MAQASANMRLTINNFDKVEKIFEKTAWNTLKKMGMFLVAESKKRCPVDTGRLRGSIQYYLSKIWGKNYLTIGATAEYAIFVHEGTRKMRKRPFIKDGILENIGKLQEIAAREYENNISGG